MRNPNELNDGNSQIEQSLQLGFTPQAMKGGLQKEASISVGELKPTTLPNIQVGNQFRGKFNFATDSLNGEISAGIGYQAMEVKVGDNTTIKGYGARAKTGIAYGPSHIEAVAKITGPSIEVSAQTPAFCYKDDSYRLGAKAELSVGGLGVKAQGGVQQSSGGIKNYKLGGGIGNGPVYAEGNVAIIQHENDPACKGSSSFWGRTTQPVASDSPKTNGGNSASPVANPTSKPHTVQKQSMITKQTAIPQPAAKSSIANTNPSGGHHPSSQPRNTPKPNEKQLLQQVDQKINELSQHVKSEENQAINHQAQVEAAIKNFGLFTDFAVNALALVNPDLAKKVNAVGQGVSSVCQGLLIGAASPITAVFMVGTGVLSIISAFNSGNKDNDSSFINSLFASINNLAELVRGIYPKLEEIDRKISIIYRDMILGFAQINSRQEDTYRLLTSLHQKFDKYQNEIHAALNEILQRQETKLARDHLVTISNIRKPILTLSERVKTYIASKQTMVQCDKETLDFFTKGIILEIGDLIKKIIIDSGSAPDDDFCLEVQLDDKFDKDYLNHNIGILFKRINVEQIPQVLIYPLFWNQLVEIVVLLVQHHSDTFSSLLKDPECWVILESLFNIGKTNFDFFKRIYQPAETKVRLQKLLREYLDSIKQVNHTLRDSVNVELKNEAEQRLAHKKEIYEKQIQAMTKVHVSVAAPTQDSAFTLGIYSATGRVASDRRTSAEHAQAKNDYLAHQNKDIDDRKARNIFALDQRKSSLISFPINSFEEKIGNQRNIKAIVIYPEDHSHPVLTLPCTPGAYSSPEKFLYIPDEIFFLEELGGEICYSYSLIKINNQFNLVIKKRYQEGSQININYCTKELDRITIPINNVWRGYSESELIFRFWYGGLNLDFNPTNSSLTVYRAYDRVTCGNWSTTQYSETQYACVPKTTEGAAYRETLISLSGVSIDVSQIPMSQLWATHRQMIAKRVYSDAKDYGKELSIKLSKMDVQYKLIFSLLKLIVSENQLNTDFSFLIKDVFAIGRNRKEILNYLSTYQGDKVFLPDYLSQLIEQVEQIITQLANPTFTLKTNNIPIQDNLLALNATCVGDFTSSYIASLKILNEYTSRNNMVDEVDSDDEGGKITDNFPLLSDSVIHRNNWHKEVAPRTGQRKPPIGEGASAIVYSGTLRNTDGSRRPIAIKTLKHNFSEGSEEHSAFIAEIENLKNLSMRNYSHIVKFFGVSCHRNKAALVLSYSILLELATQSLNNYLQEIYKSQRKLSQIEQLELALHIASGLAEAHAVGMLHCDLKDENILLFENNMAKISDFGLGEICRKTTMLKSTKTADRKGTLSWQAPEVVLGLPHSYDSDMYSFALILFRIVTHGSPLFDDDKSKQLLPLSPNLLIQKYTRDLNARPKIPENTDKFLKELIQVCWIGLYEYNSDDELVPIRHVKRLSAQEVVEKLEAQLSSENIEDCGFASQGLQLR